jgi:thiamine pyrophosphate-dependent acetolactate synthase large subunit-like protein
VWIHSIHTARDQGALVRNYTKWDDQPGSPIAARESVFRAAWIANTAPRGPTYVNLDVEVQEQKLSAPVPAVADASRYMPKVTSGPDAAGIKAAVELLLGAKKLVVMAGRVSRDTDAWATRIAFVERLGARVITQLKVAAAFPTDHPLHIGAPGVIGLAPESAKALQEADVILSLDWLDVSGTFKAAGEVTAKVIQISIDHRLHNGWSMDYQGLPTVDVMIDCEPDAAVPVLLEALGPGKAVDYPPAAPAYPELSGEKITVDHMSDALRRAVGPRPASLTHLPLSWNGASWAFKHPLDYLGSDGGGGVGGGPGMAVGAALALKGSGRLPIAVCGDGDFLMGVTSLWTAVHYKIPILFVLSNNRSFFNDELHQERVARMRNRPVENRWIGQRISDPDIDLASLGRAQGAQGFTVENLADLDATLAEAIAVVDAGGVAVVDVRVEVGYAGTTMAAATGGKSA